MIASTRLGPSKIGSKGRGATGIDRTGNVEMMIRYSTLIALEVVCFIGAVQPTAYAQRAPTTPPKSSLVGESAAVQRMNEWTIGLAGGLLEGTFIRFAAEIGNVLDDPPNLRILPVVSYGAVGNVEDLLYLKGIDVAITQADVLDYFKRDGKTNNIGDRVNYIIRFFLAEVHVYARSEIKSFADLADFLAS